MKKKNVIIKEREEINLLNKINVSQNYFLFLFPQEKINKKINLVNSRDIINDKSQLKLLKKTNKIKKNFVKKISNQNFNQANISNLRHFFLTSISSMAFVFEIIKKVTPCYAFKGKKLIRYNKVKEIYPIIFKKIFINKKLITFSVPEKINYSLINKILKKIIIYLLKSKKIIIFSADNKNFQSIAQDVYLRKKIYCINILHEKNNVFLKSIKTILKIINPFKKNALIGLPIHSQNYLNNKKKIYHSLDGKEEFIGYVKNDFANMLSKSINYQESIRLSVEEYFQKLKISLLISHHTRGIVPSLIADIAKNNSVKSILIPHGTIPEANNKNTLELIKEVATGFVFDKFSDEIIVQSKITKNFIEKYYKKTKYQKFKPVMW